MRPIYTTAMRLEQAPGVPYTLKDPFPMMTEVSILPPFARTGAALPIAILGAITLAGAVRSRAQVREGSQAALTPETRDALPGRDFAIPRERKYPIHDLEHGRLALTFVAAPSNIAYRYRVLSRVFSRYPSLVNWWAETKPGLAEPLSGQLFTDKIREYRARLAGANSSTERDSLEAEIAALQALFGMSAHLHRKARSIA